MKTITNIPTLLCFVLLFLFMAVASCNVGAFAQTVTVTLDAATDTLAIYDAPPDLVVEFRTTEPQARTLAYTNASLQAAIDLCAPDTTGLLDEEGCTFDICNPEGERFDSVYVDVTGFLPRTVVVGDGVAWRQSCPVTVGPENYGEGIDFDAQNEVYWLAFNPRSAPSGNARADTFRHAFNRIYFEDYCTLDRWLSTPNDGDDSAASWVWKNCTASGEGQYRGIQFRSYDDAKGTPWVIEGLHISGMNGGHVTVGKDAPVTIRNSTFECLGYCMNVGSGELDLTFEDVHATGYLPEGWNAEDTCSGARHKFYFASDTDLTTTNSTFSMGPQAECHLYSKPRWLLRTFGEAGDDRWQRHTNARFGAGQILAKNFFCLDCTFTGDILLGVGGHLDIENSAADTLRITSDLYRTDGAFAQWRIGGSVFQKVDFRLHGTRAQREVKVMNSRFGQFVLSKSAPGNVYAARLTVLGSYIKENGKPEKRLFSTNKDAYLWLRASDLRGSGVMSRGFTVDAESTTFNGIPVE